jgi:hypothetical protein
MATLLESSECWPSLLLFLLVFGFAPGFCLRLIVLAHPDKDRRRELIAELYVIPPISRPLWVAQQLEVALCEGLGQRVSAALQWLRDRCGKPRRSDATVVHAQVQVSEQPPESGPVVFVGVL